MVVSVTSNALGSLQIGHQATAGLVRTEPDSSVSERNLLASLAFSVELRANQHCMLLALAQHYRRARLLVLRATRRRSHSHRLEMQQRTSRNTGVCQ